VTSRCPWCTLTTDHASPSQITDGQSVPSLTTQCAIRRHTKDEEKFGRKHSLSLWTLCSVSNSPLSNGLLKSVFSMYLDSFCSHFFTVHTDFCIARPARVVVLGVSRPSLLAGHTREASATVPLRNQRDLTEFLQLQLFLLHLP